MTSVSPALDGRFRTAALAARLVDVRTDLVDSPVGPLFVAATEQGLLRVSFTPAEAEDAVARQAGRRLLRVPLDDVRRELDEYFAGRRTRFDLALDLRVAPFGGDVLRELAKVPYGRTTTYGALAAAVGRPRAARAVGTALNRNPLPIVLPCHRVVAASGALTGYAGGLERKERLLSLEGVRPAP